MMWLVSTVIAAPMEKSALADKAEIQRLRERMNRYQESGALEYSEKVYKQMLEIDTKNQWMTDGDHLAGAVASNARGDLQTTLKRLERCRDSERATKWKVFLWEETGPVKIERVEGADLSIMMGLMSPEQLAAIDYANAYLASNKAFEGRLPNGAYQYGQKQFLVSATGLTMAGEATQDQVLSQGKKESFLSTLGSSIEMVALSTAGDVGAWHISSGDVVDSMVAIPAQTYISTRIEPSIALQLEQWRARGFLSGRFATRSLSRTYMFSSGLDVGYTFGAFTPTLGLAVDVARLEFETQKYIKRSLGYSVRARTEYNLSDQINLHAILDAGILGSHNTVGFAVGSQYTF